MFHVTIVRNVESILRVGLKPNHRPTRWVLDTASARGCRGVFLAESYDRVLYWGTIIAEWAALEDDDEQVVLAVDVCGLPIEPNSPDDDRDDLPGDWLCLADVPPDRITVLGPPAYSWRKK